MIRSKLLLGLLPLLAFAGCSGDTITGLAGKSLRPKAPTATVAVSSTSDAGPGSLRQAIADAASGDVIDVTATGTITLASTLTIDKDLTINGPTSGTLVLSGANARVVMQLGSLSGAYAVSLRNLTIANGNGWLGAGITNFGTLTIRSMQFHDNHAFASGGGFGAEGGAIATYGPLTVDSSTFTGNSATLGLDGTTGGRGGAIASLSTLVVTNSTFDGNTAYYGAAIAAANVYGATISGSTFTNNTAISDGGAIMVADGDQLDLTTSTLSGNSAGFGGGIHNAGVARISRTLIKGNTAITGGAINNEGTGTLTLANSTLTVNGSSSTYGGGIFNNNGRIMLSNNTIASNTARQGGGINTYGNGFGVGNKIINNVVALNSATDAGPDIYGDIGLGQVTTNNLLTNVAGGSNISNGVNSNIVSATPLLDTLASNGGPTKTMALLVGSPAIDVGSSSVCAASPVSAIDQRGTLRPSACDIGAFEKSVNYNLTVGRSGSGTITSDIGTINCGTACNNFYAAGTVVTLTATPATGWSFDYWLNAQSVDGNKATMNMTQTRNVMAYFKISQYTLSVSRGISGGGSITSSPAGIDCPSEACEYDYDYGTDIILTAVPSAGYEFVSWSGDGTTDGDGTRTVDMTQAQSVTATFQIAVVNYQLAINNSGNGIVTSNPSGINCGATCVFDFSSGTSVTLSAVPASGYVFSGWSGDGTTNGSGNRVVSMSQAQTVTATFTQATPPPPVGPVLTVSLAGLGAGTVTSNPAGISCSTSGGTCSASFPIRTRVTLTATPGAGSIFSGWSGGASGTTGSVDITLRSNAAVTATFGTAPWATIDAAGAFDRTNGAANVGGTLSCTPGNSKSLTVTVIQQQKAGKTSVQVSGNITSITACGARWSFSVAPATAGAKYVRGDAQVTVSDGVESKSQTVSLK